MNRTIASDEVGRQWNSVVDITKNGDEVIVEDQGEAQAVVVSPEAYQELQQAREKQRRAEAMVRLEALQRRQAERNKDLTDEEIDEIAIRVGREINAAVTKKWRESLEADRP